MRVVFVAWRDLVHPDAGGAEVLVDRLIRGLNERGHEGALVCGGPAGRPGYPVVSAGGTYTQYLRAPFATRRFRDFDLLVDMVNGLPYLSPLWWRGPRLCFFHHVHGDQWHGQFGRGFAEMGSFVESKIVPRLYRRSPFAAVSRSTALALQELGVSAGQIHLVHNGVDEALLGQPVPTSEQPLFLVLGRLAANKSVGRVLDAWEHVGSTVGGRLVVAGDGPQRKELQSRRVPGVEFLGRVSESEKRTLLGSAWLMLHAARHEGWGISIMEAAAQRTPTLAFDADGVRDSIIHERTGLLVATPEMFEHEWIALARDPARLAHLGGDARQRALGFTWERSVDEFLAAASAAVESS